MTRIYIGCCGLPRGKERYFKVFKAVELQNTFYELPTVDEAKSFRASIPSDATITMKAWQVITHPSTSPTWKRMKRKPSGNLANYGFLKPTQENFNAWKEVLAIARTFAATFIVLQTPPSFGYSEENLRNVVQFFNTIERDGIYIGWEPRGSWKDHREAISKVVTTCNIVHVTDILRVDPVEESIKLGVIYIRLHGLGGSEVNYRYRYTDEDLRKLAEKIRLFIETYNVKTVYVFFNNIYMFDDAKRFRDICTEVVKDLAEII